MKKLTYIYISIIFLVTCVGFTACVNETQLQPISELIIQVNMPYGFKDSVKYSNQTVFLKSNRITYSVLTDSLGVAVFKDVIPDIYSISTTCEINGEKYIQLANTIVENINVVLSGNLQKQQIFNNKEIVLSLSKALKQSLLISKIYASGTKDNNNKSYVADRYIEVFNNSDQVQYMDSIYMGLVEAESVIAFPASSNPGYVYARQIFQFPGTGKQYPVQPGKSIVIANSAIDHTVNSPNSVNLFNADFEAKSPIYSNNSNVPEMKLIYTAYASLIYMNLVNGGDNGLFLFKTKDKVAEYPIFYIPGKTSGNRYMRIPINNLFDGVETLKNKATVGPDVNTKRLQSFVDAGFLFITATSGYTHESIERRVVASKSNAERVYLIDSNNSSNDFRTVTDPTPKKYDKALLMAN